MTRVFCLRNFINVRRFHIYQSMNFYMSIQLDAVKSLSLIPCSMWYHPTYQITMYPSCLPVDCSPATDMEPVLSCSDSTLTVSWPTDLVYGGDVIEIPPLIAGRMEDSLRSKGLILSLVITSHRPP